MNLTVSLREPLHLLGVKLDEVLEHEGGPGLDQQTALAYFSHLDRGKSQLADQTRDFCTRVLIVTRKEDDALPA